MTILPGVLVANKMQSLTNGVRDRKCCIFSRLDMITIISSNKNGFVASWLQQVSQKLLKISKIYIDGRENTPGESMA